MDDLTPFDTARHLTEEDRLALLRDAAATGDAATLAKAIGIVARARGMSELGEQVGRSRQHRYRALSETGNPTLGTVLGVLDALGLRLAIEPRTEPTTGGTRPKRRAAA